jgi:hypothetical protein
MHDRGIAAVTKFFERNLLVEGTNTAPRKGGIVEWLEC